jgi:hypothetical protein
MLHKYFSDHMDTKRHDEKICSGHWIGKETIKERYVAPSVSVCTGGGGWWFRLRNGLEGEKGSQPSLCPCPTRLNLWQCSLIPMAPPLMRGR